MRGTGGGRTGQESALEASLPSHHNFSAKIPANFARTISFTARCPRTNAVPNHSKLHNAISVSYFLGFDASWCLGTGVKASSETEATANLEEDEGGSTAQHRSMKKERPGGVEGWGR